jgi:hypothetical protein
MGSCISAKIRTLQVLKKLPPVWVKFGEGARREFAITPSYFLEFVIHPISNYIPMRCLDICSNYKLVLKIRDKEND